MFVDVDRHGSFHLPPELLEAYRQRPVPWGFGALSWITYKRSYSRDGEEWWQTCQRVVEGMLTLQRIHCLERGLPWDAARAEAEAADAYRRMWSFRWTPSGRGLWIMGTRFVYERGSAALNNCGFVSTRDLRDDYAAPFTWVLGMSMLGVGVGFDTRGVGQVEIVRPLRGDDTHEIEDSREGWCGSLERLLHAYTGRGTMPTRWSFARIRPRGIPLRGFGGVAGGPDPLREMLESLEKLHDQAVGRRVDARLIVDTMNLIGRCVVAGGIRRSAQIALGSPDDASFLDLKADPERLRSHGWVSNNSVFAQIGMDYGDVARRTVVNGEPGYFWLENARAYGRMQDPPNHVDDPALGTNPCVEQTLWDRELCCLVETFPAHHDTLDDYLRTLRAAYTYAKTVTLVPTHDVRTNDVMLRNRRIGCSMSGIVQAIERHGRRTFLRWCDEAYANVRSLDRELSDRFGVPRSIKSTSVKPSGSVSLLAGATPGVHWDAGSHYLRRLRVGEDHPLVRLCSEAGYPVEPDVYSARTAVIAFPVHVPHLARGREQVSVWEKVELAAALQRHWSDNQVSCTADFDPQREAADLPQILSAYEDRLKGIVFLPQSGHGYPQPPYEPISPERYTELAARLSPLREGPAHEELLEESFCEGGACDIDR
jgi:ribonucleoside-triphosphate reductase (thioredoxin)